MKLNRLINELVKLSSKHGDIPVRLVQECQLPPHRPYIERKRVASEPLRVKEDEGVVFVEGFEE